MENSYGAFNLLGSFVQVQFSPSKFPFTVNPPCFFQSTFKLLRRQTKPIVHLHITPSKFSSIL